MQYDLAAYKSHKVSMCRTWHRHTTFISEPQSSKQKDTVCPVPDMTYPVPNSGVMGSTAVQGTTHQDHHLHGFTRNAAWPGHGLSLGVQASAHAVFIQVHCFHAAKTPTQQSHRAASARSSGRKHLTFWTIQKAPFKLVGARHLAPQGMLKMIINAYSRWHGTNSWWASPLDPACCTLNAAAVKMHGNLTVCLPQPLHLPIG
jgi:hypothetical protein